VFPSNGIGLVPCLLAVQHHRGTAKLAKKQQSKWCRNLHDDQLAVGVQTTGSRLLSNLAEVIFKERANLLQLEQRRALLAKILAAMVSKIATLRESLPSFMTPSIPFPFPPITSHTHRAHSFSLGGCLHGSKGSQFSSLLNQP
jgi:hypothetical protein